MTLRCLPPSWLDDPVVSSLGPDTPGFSLPVGTVTFLLTDIEASTKGWEAAPKTMGGAVARHYELLDEAITAHNGVRPVEQGEGDSVVGAFARASDALAAALDAQRALAAEPWPDGTALRVRMAIHTGEAEMRGEGNYFGPAVIRCARLRAIAHGGQVLVSAATAEMVADHLPDGASLTDLGSHRLKDLGRPERVFEVSHPELGSDFGALRSLDALPNNLPVQLNTFVGRRAELAELVVLLRTTRLLSLNGAGGCGKTRTAMQLAAEVAEGYPGGTWLVELAPVGDPDRVPAIVATALGERDLSGDLTEVIVGRIGEGPTLIILDNCEHLLDPIASLADLLLRRCPGLVILATSREPLGVPGETAWRVPSLSLPGRAEPVAVTALSTFDAVRLFLDRAARARPNFALTDANAPAVAQICARLDGIPLAIELAAARVRGLTVDQIAAGLDDRFRLLTGGARTVLPRQQTLQASVDWGYELLSDTERAAFRRLTVLVGSFALDAAEEIVATEEIDSVAVLDLLLALVDKSMVVADEHSGRYRMTETLRQYGLARLVEAGETVSVRNHHLNWVLSLVGDPIEDGLSGRNNMARFDPDIDNLRAAFEWAMTEVKPDPAHVVATTLVRWESRRGDAAEAVTAGTRALALPGGERGLRLMVMAGVLVALFEAGETGEVVSMREALLDELGDLDDDRLRCLCLRTAAFTSGGGRRTFELLQGAAEAAHRAGHVEGERSVASLLAAIHALSGDWREAERVARQALVSGVPDDGSDLNAILALRYAAQATGRFDEARAHLERERRAAIGLGSPRLAFQYAAAVVQLDLAQGRDSGAVAELGPLLDEVRRRRFGFAIVMGGSARGGWALADGDLDTAMRELLAWRDEGGGRNRGSERMYLTQALLASGRFDEADADIEAIRRQAESLVNAARLAHVEGLLRRAQGDLGGAERLHHEALAAQHGGGWRPDLAHSLEALAGGAAAHEEHLGCARLAGAAQALRDDMGYVLRWPFEQGLLDEDLAAARAALGGEVFDAAYLEGRGLDDDAAVAYATRARGERRRPSTGWDSLTPTEGDVARLAAQGLTNKEIGERLLMGAETVKTHLARTYDKLGVRTRAALASVVGTLD